MYFISFIFGQGIDHAYYTSKIYGPGDAASKELWVNMDDVDEDQWRVHGFVSSAHRQAEVSDSVSYVMLCSLTCCS